MILCATLLLLVESVAALNTSCDDVETAHALLHDGIQRSYTIFVPSTVCAAARESVPLLVALHCLGCDASVELDKLRGVAAEHQFILLAPEGIGRSWNALECCGEALARKVDDVGFVSAAVEAVRLRVSAISPLAVYATGFSNGGFLTTLLATSRRASRWLRAIAPLSGYVSTGYAAVRAPLPYFALHSNSDTMVRSTGCCTAGAAPCCCGIVSSIDACVAIDDVFDTWARINRCSANGSAALRRWSAAPPAGFPQGNRGAASCREATGCAAETALCVYSGVQHTDWARLSGSTLAVMRDVALFFARVACKHGGKWDAASGTCACRSLRSGRHCLVVDAAPHAGIGDALAMPREGGAEPLPQGGTDSAGLPWDWLVRAPSFGRATRVARLAVPLALLVTVSVGAARWRRARQRGGATL
jgi:poly(3-hydroxybutyrate) depolymerase